MPVVWNQEAGAFELEVEIYKATDGYRWRYRADNGEITQAATEGFSSKQACKDNVARYRADIIKSDGVRWVDVES